MNAQNTGIVDAARDWIGTPYRHQASRIGVGCDCLGLVRGIWQRIYGQNIGPVPVYTQFGRDPESAFQLLEAAQYYLNETKSLPVPGAVMLFQLHKKLPPRHCGIFVGDDQFIHAQEHLGVVQVSFDKSWHRRMHSTYLFPKKV